MEGVKEKQGQLVFGLDIGTRSIVGTVGYLNGGKFHVLAQRSKEHETRAMLDGQIHDIGKVGETISQVKEQLEADLGRELTEVCIAAAGRVLRTVTTYVEHSFESDREITQEDVYSLCTMGVEKAYEEFQNSNTDTDMKFYCVGYTAMRYYMNGYQMGNLEGHKAKNIAVDLIATFLPDDVVDGLYKAVELAGLHVANLTLEPIAAIQVAIPEKFRMLNMALVDVGAGTSDISITKEGTITAYGMIPVAGRQPDGYSGTALSRGIRGGRADQEKMQNPGDYRIRRYHGTAPDHQSQRSAGTAGSGDRTYDPAGIRYHQRTERGQTGQCRVRGRRRWNGARLHGEAGRKAGHREGTCGNPGTGSHADHYI